mmetsp:Transcript_85438/g.275010  ORF Transcript_85438/g.275010 Transcript_85438/m.275010 type:complete len:137 (-) Transcript_85438:312-722(-)
MAGGAESSLEAHEAFAGACRCSGAQLSATTDLWLPGDPYWHAGLCSCGCACCEDWQSGDDEDWEVEGEDAAQKVNGQDGQQGASPSLLRPFHAKGLARRLRRLLERSAGGHRRSRCRSFGLAALGQATQKTKGIAS